MMGVRFPSARAVAHVDTDALCENYRRICTYAARPVMAVVKANAYGHGYAHTVPALVDAGCRHFAVATVEEGRAVRALAPEAQILVLGYTPPCEAGALCEAALTQSVFSLPYAAALSGAAVACGLTLPVQIKVDTGMCRLGVAHTATEELERIAALPALCVTGVYTHFPRAGEDARDTARAARRLAALRQLFPGACFHAAASDAITLESARFDYVRAGIALYGYGALRAPLALSPTLCLTAPVVQLREVPRGTPVGYSGAYVTPHRARIGVLPVGYADGLHTALAGLPVSLLHAGLRFPVKLCGRICMDACMVDLTGTPAEVGDNICLIEDAEQVASAAGSIAYEVLAALGTRVRRQQKGAIT